MNGKQLKNSILQWAIQGKLVPQDASEEPAIELLKRINPKFKPVEYEEELPQGWCWCKINDYVKLVTDFVASGSFASLRENVKYYKEENYAILVRTLDLQNNFTKSKVYTDKHGYDFLNNSNLEGGELILPNVGSIGKVFIVPKLDKRMTLAPNSIMLRFHDESHIVWFYYLFSSLYGQSLIHSITSKTAQPKFNKTSFRNLTVPLPPLAEQKRIVAKIEELMPLVERYTKAQEGLDKLNAGIKGKLRASILQEAIQGKLVPQDASDEPAIELLKRLNPKFKPVEYEGKLPEGWSVCLMKDVANYINGRAFKPEEWKTKGLPIIRIQNLNDSSATYNYSSCVYEDKYLVKKGDLLFAWSASLDSFIWKGGDAWLNQHIFKVEPFLIMDKYFLFYLLKAIIQDIYSNTHGLAMVHITRKKFENLKILVPPLAEQKRIVAKIEELFAVLNTIETNLN